MDGKQQESVGLISGVRLVDAPILLLVLFHKALRAELVDLCRVAVEASESESRGRDVILILSRRFEFLKLFYKYHCASEDEIIFLALDKHVKNVTNTYSLEHTSMDNIFDSIFHCLNSLVEDAEKISEKFQELVFCIGTIQTVVNQHMLKEEEQVFPLLIQQVPAKEQASLVWQFLCSVPVMFLEDFLPWTISFLSSDEQLEARCCLKEVVPKEKLLQEVVISWLDEKNQPSSETYTNEGKGAQYSDGTASLKYMRSMYTSKSVSWKNWKQKKLSTTKTTVRRNPLDSFCLWHCAIRKDLKEILEELYQMRSSKDHSTLSSVVVQLKFFADVLICYRNALEKIFYPALNELAKEFPSPLYEQFPESQIEGLQRLLYYNTREIPLCKFIEKLCGEVKLFRTEISKYLVILESEVFPFIINSCSYEMQQWLVYTSLLMMPLGLLKCVITWFSAHLTDDESKSILDCIKQRGPLANQSFACLLQEWVRIGYSGKASIENFRKDLMEMFNVKHSFLSYQTNQESGCSCLQLDTQHCSVSNPEMLDLKSAIEAQKHISDSSSGSNTTKKHHTSYSSGISLRIFFPQTLEMLPAENTGNSSPFNLDPKPTDYIFFIHKALRKDLEYLVFVSAELAENVGFLMDFRQRFFLVQNLFQIHSVSEDEIAFPALEAKGKIQNISHSYSIDHQLEAEHFNKISLILTEISGLHISDVNIDVYRHLCARLHHMCKSMHKVLCDHVIREEIELWPLFRECFSIEEQENIIGCMLGRTTAEVLQEMIPWLMGSLTPEEQNATMSLWRKATKNTMFDEWLQEWWEGMPKYDMAKAEKVSDIRPSWIDDPLEIISRYLYTEGYNNQGQTTCDRNIEVQRETFACPTIEPHGNVDADDDKKVLKDQNSYKFPDSTEFSRDTEKRSKKTADVTDQGDIPGHLVQKNQKFSHQDHLQALNQEELETAIRRVSRDPTLDPQKRSYIIQNLLMSRWIITQVAQQKSLPEVTFTNEEKLPSQCPSFRDPLKSTFGCKHYKRNCKLVAACCNQLYTCRLCHDELADHSMDRKATTTMMCMKCLKIQPVGPTCSTVSCNNFSMAKYYCRICKFFDDERAIYHCPYCNLCRLGKGLGIDYFHCMNCNACMSLSLSVHTCREKCFEDNCPICHESIFTSSTPVKALPCGHLMHSTCFQDYTCTHYTCPICSKSLGDMQVYFGMLDALLAEQKIPEEYLGQTQVILCNDCEKRGPVSFHWLHHKCPYCGSYNTRLL